MQTIDYASVTDSTHHLCLLGVEKPLNQNNYELPSIFDIEIWVLLLISIVLVTIFNTKYNRNQNSFMLLVKSFTNHLEILLSKSGKSIPNQYKIKPNYSNKTF